MFPLLRKSLFVFLLQCVAQAEILLPTVPQFELKKLEIEIPTDTRAFQGTTEKDVKSVLYVVQGQYFPKLGDARFPIPKQNIDVKQALLHLKNPYLTLAVGTAVDKFGDNAGRILLSNPICAEQFQTFFTKDVTDSFKKMFSASEEIDIILSIQADDKLFVFYEVLEPLKKSSKGRVLVRTIQSFSGVYLFDCQPVTSPLILNVLTVLTTQGREKLQVRNENKADAKESQK